ncbi:hypothetical protein [Lysobacter gummosus]|uniref:hypothetical protein n=1 Tax=Lysobacter gummosus TaxID=262324 RepID=UPI003642F054
MENQRAASDCGGLGCGTSDRVVLLVGQACPTGLPADALKPSRLCRAGPFDAASRAQTLHTPRNAVEPCAPPPKVT